MILIRLDDVKIDIEEGWQYRRGRSCTVAVWACFWRKAWICVLSTTRDIRIEEVMLHIGLSQRETLCRLIHRRI